MANTLIVAKNLWRNGDIIAYSSQHPAFPAVCTQEDDTTLAWRSRYGTGTGNGLFVVDANNKYIDFDEGGAELTATITPGSYTGTSLATEVNSKMDAAGGTYVVAYSLTTGKFTISRAAGNFTLRWQSGTNTANTAAGLLGFDAAANDTGADTYTSDYARFNTYEYLDLDNGSALEYDFVALVGHGLSSAAVVTIYGADDDAFTTNVVSDVIAYNESMMSDVLGTARTKRYIRIKVEDPANAAGYISLSTIVIGKGLSLGIAPNFPIQRGKVSESESDSTPSKNRFLTSPAPALERWAMSWSHLTPTVRGYIDDAIEEAKGSVYAVVWCLDSSDPNHNTIWGRMLTQDYTSQTRAGTTTALWTWSVEIEEHV